MQKKSEIVLQALNKIHHAFADDLTFDRLSIMLDPVLEAYIDLTGANEVAISFFNYYYENSNPVVSVFSKGEIDSEIYGYFEKVKQEQSDFSSFQKIYNEIYLSKQTVATKLDGMNFLGVPLVTKNRILGIVCLFNVSHTDGLEDDPYIQSLNQGCLVVAIGQRESRKNREALRILEIKDEMLNMVIDRVEKQKKELNIAKIAAESANHAKNVIIANLGHEFRTPLTTIISSTELLKLTEPTQKQQRFHQTIALAAEHLLSLVNNLLDIAKIESGSFEVQLSHFDLSQLALEVANTFSLKAYEQKIDFFFYYDPNVSRSCYGDVLIIKQVLINLLGNAIKFTKSGYVYLSVKLENNNVLFQIEDTGIGIKDESKDKIFKRFYQVDATISRQFGGTGLGLELCKNLVEKLNGSISFNSIYNQGSTFYFTLPLKMEKKPLSFKALNTRVGIITSKNHWNGILESYLNFLKARPEIFSDKNRLNDFSCIITDEDSLDEEFFQNLKNYRGKVILISNFFEEKKLNLPLAQILDNPFLVDQLYHLIEGTSWDMENFRAKILVIDDYAINLELTKEILEALGCFVDATDSGSSAIDLFKTNDYDMVFMDLQMPDLSGYEVTEELRKIEKGGKRVPIIALTANVVEEDEDKHKKAGMNGYLSKPIRIKEIEDVLQKYL